MTLQSADGNDKEALLNEMGGMPTIFHCLQFERRQSQAFIRDEIMAKVGELGVAVYDCILAGVCPSVLVGRVELGSPTLYRVKAVKREVGEVVGNGKHTNANFHHDT